MILVIYDQLQPVLNGEQVETGLKFLESLKYSFCAGDGDKILAE